MYIEACSGAFSWLQSGLCVISQLAVLWKGVEYYNNSN